MAAHSERVCNALRRDGEACRARAITPDGKCAAHGGLVNMAEVGRLGGRASVRRRLGIDGDDALRRKARATLDGMLDSDDPRVQIQAARSLFSYSQTPTPREDAHQPIPPPVLASGRRPTGLADVLVLATELGVDVGQLTLQRENAELRAENERLRNKPAG
jgi:hypothetical protein